MNSTHYPSGFFAFFKGIATWCSLCENWCAVRVSPSEGLFKEILKNGKSSISSDFQEQLNKLLDGPKTLADIWTRWRMRITLTLPRGTSGNGTKTTGSLSQNAQGKHAPVTGREDFSDAVKAIKDLRQKDEQQSNYPILPSHQTRRRPFQERQWTWSSWSTLSSSSTEWERVATVADFSKSGRITIFQQTSSTVSLTGSGRKASIVHRTAHVSHTQTFSRVWLKGLTRV